METNNNIETFTVEELLTADVLDDPLSDVIVELTRWSVVHQVIFRYKEKYWRTEYTCGATEEQEETPWQHEEEVDCVEMEFKEVTRATWVPKEYIK